MKKTILIAAAAMMLIGCRAGGNSFYGSPEPPKCGTDDATILTGTIVVEDDSTRDEYGNCKKSPYTKFYEEWEEREGWTDGMERVYNAWITLDYQYFVQTIKCTDAERHQYEVVNHKVKDRDTYLKYSDRNKGYGGNKGVVFID